MPLAYLTVSSNASARPVLVFSISSFSNIHVRLNFTVCIQCLQGPAGMPGNNGVPGSPATPGRDGRDGRDGGKGEVGTRGPAGDKGDKGDTSVSGNTARNWKQCVWKAEDNKDIGLIKVSIFKFPFTGEKGMSVHVLILSIPSVCQLVVCQFVHLCTHQSVDFPVSPSP